MLGFISRTYYKSKLAIFDSSPPQDEELEKIRTEIENSLAQVQELRLVLQHYVTHQLSMIKMNQTLAGQFDKFFSQSPVKSTQDAVSTYTSVHSLFDNSASALFRDGLKSKIWSVFDTWYTDTNMLKLKLDVLEQARVFVYAKKYEVKTLQDERDAKIESGKDITAEEAKWLREQTTILGHYGTALELMRAEVCSSADVLVKPQGLYTVFDAVLMNFMHFQSSYFNSAMQLSSAFQSIIVGFRDSIKIREGVNEIKAAAAETRRPRGDSEVHGRLHWTNLESGQEALEQIAKQLQGPVVPDEEPSTAAVQTPTAPATANDAEAQFIAETKKVEEQLQRKESSTVVAEESSAVVATSEPPAKEPTDPYDTEDPYAGNEQPTADDTKTDAADESWERKVSQWSATSTLGDLPASLNALPSLLYGDMEWKVASSAEDFSEVSKRYRQAIALFSPYKPRPDDISEEHFKLVTSTVTSTLKKQFMSYRQQHG